MRIALPRAAIAASRDVVSRVLSALKLRRNRRALHDLDNDLLIINDNITPAIGEISHLTGRVLSANGTPLKDLTVEIWHRLQHIEIARVDRW